MTIDSISVLLKLEIHRHACWESVPCNLFDYPRRDASHHCVSQYIPSDYSASSHHSTTTYAYSVGDDGSSPDPDIILHHNTLSSDALFDEGSLSISKNVVYSRQLHRRRGVYSVAYVNATLPSQHVELANKAIPSDLYTSMGQITKIVHMQFCMVHDKRVLANGDTPGARVQVHTLIQVRIPPYMNATGKSYPHPFLNGNTAIDVHDESVGHRSQPYTYQCWDPAK
jgi:hypothetical protein